MKRSIRCFHGAWGNLTRCVPRPRLPLPLGKSPDADENCCLFWRTQLGLKEGGHSVFQNIANTLKQLFGSGQVISPLQAPALQLQNGHCKGNCFTKMLLRIEWDNKYMHSSCLEHSKFSVNVSCFSSSVW